MQYELRVVFATDEKPEPESVAIAESLMGALGVHNVTVDGIYLYKVE